MSSIAWPLVHILGWMRRSKSKMRDCQDFRSVFRNPGRFFEISHWSDKRTTLVDRMVYRAGVVLLLNGEHNASPVAGEEDDLIGYDVTEMSPALAGSDRGVGQRRWSFRDPCGIAPKLLDHSGS